MEDFFGDLANAYREQARDGKEILFLLFAERARVEFHGWIAPTVHGILVRIVLARAKPGDRFDVQPSPNGYVLRKLVPVESKPAKVRFVKRAGYTVAIADQPINEQALREALADFP